MGSHCGKCMTDIEECRCKKSKLPDYWPWLLFTVAWIIGMLVIGFKNGWS